MNKLYLIVPVIGVILFSAYYWNFNKEHVAKEEAKKAQVAAQLRQKQIADQEARAKAYEEAIKAQEQRKREREERERVEEEKKKLRQDLEDRRERVFTERKRAKDYVERMKKEVAAVEEELKKIEVEKKSLQDEQAFLKTYVKQAQSNVKYYYDLLDKIEAAEKARLEAERAAAAAAKKS
jgi:type IV secretory pathway VirB10-like protein